MIFTESRDTMVGAMNILVDSWRPSLIQVTRSFTAAMPIFSVGWAMRVTGAADPTVSVKDTMKGKLPQKKLVRGAANGYSSYGNQLSLIHI